MDTSKVLPSQSISADDKYTASIELSNACRQFYKSRVEAAHCIKSKWEKQAAHQKSQCCDKTNDNDRLSADQESSKCDNRTTHRRHKSSIDEAMDKLRTEMTSLMDQDLSLMKQLLTLNETIEDLKWQRRYYCPSRSSADLEDDSDCSISDTDMYESEDDLLFLPSSSSKSPNTTTTTTTATTTTSCRRHSVTSHKSERRCSDSSESPAKTYHGEQDSFDSGIHESCSSEEEALEAAV
ncbi:hypothetical protein ACOMHN_024642 [Nucella lapillus]